MKKEKTQKNDPVAMTAMQVKKISDVTDYEIKKLGLDVMDVQYADFTQNPEEIIEAILSYTGLSADKACISYFKKNKIYNRNKKDEEYFDAKDLETISKIYAAKNPFVLHNI